MTPAEFRTLRPHLLHLTYPENRPSIEALGLIPIGSLVARSDLPASRQRLATSRPRPEELSLRIDGRHHARIRDNGVMRWDRLQRCVEGLSPAAFCRLLNSHSFFWPTRDRVAKLTTARAYRTRPHLLLSVPTARLDDATLAKLHVSRINSGSTLYTPAVRGRATYRPLAEASEREVARAAEYALRAEIPADVIAASQWELIAAAETP